MGVENIMYFALGVLLAGLVALMIMPAIWRRAVRLTRMRIEAATPITMAEFRADKDRLRAEFALTTRRLEMQVETLRARLAQQVREANAHKSDIVAARTERETQLAVLRDLEERETGLRQRIAELERESAELAQKLRVRDRTLADRDAELGNARAALRHSVAVPAEFDGSRLSGNYAADVQRLIEVIGVERTRMRFLEEQNRTLILQLEGSPRRSAEAAAAAEEVRRALSGAREAAGRTSPELLAAEAHIADAESRLDVVLAETSGAVANGDGTGPELLLAERLSANEQLAHLRARIEAVESALLSDQPAGEAEKERLRERLGEIAADVARLVYGVDGRDGSDGVESLAAVVQRYAEDGRRPDQLPIRTALKPRPARVGPGNGSATIERLPVRDLHSTN